MCTFEHLTSSEYNSSNKAKLNLRLGKNAAKMYIVQTSKEYKKKSRLWVSRQEITVLLSLGMLMSNRGKTDLEFEGKDRILSLKLEV